jgi:imidazolonepropionase-like amidohydrolase
LDPRIQEGSLTSERLLIQGGTALLGVDLTPTALGEIVIEDGRIAEIAVSQSARPGVVVDATDKVVMPGLIDAHVHLGLPGGLESLQDHLAPPFRRFVTMTRNGAADLVRGVTSVRDVGEVDALAIHYAGLTERFPGVGPRVTAAGRFIVPPGGHGASVGVEVDDAEGAREATACQIASGATVVKLMASGGFSSPTGPQSGGLDYPEPDLA